MAQPRDAARLNPFLSGCPPVARLALDGADVAGLIGAQAGSEIGAALRWLEAQVAQNPQLNTRQALTALLRFAPASAWARASPGALHGRSRRAHSGAARRARHGRRAARRSF